MTYKICVIGSEELIFPFLQFGITTHTPRDAASLRASLRDAISAGYGIIYIEDSYCAEIKDIMDEYREAHVPIIVPIGEGRDGTSYSEQVMKDMMEKAIGISLP